MSRIDAKPHGDRVAVSINGETYRLTKHEVTVLIAKLTDAMRGGVTYD
jgi:hypothetical protein